MPGPLGVSIQVSHNYGWYGTGPTRKDSILQWERIVKRNLVLLLGLAVLLAVLVGAIENGAPTAVEAPAGFDGLTNGFVPQIQHDLDRDTYNQQESVADGLGPVYNAQSCGECHQSPVAGGLSQITELRVGRLQGRTFVNPPGGSLINDRATDARIQEHVPDGYDVQTFRTSLNTLGDGFVEAIADSTLISIANQQAAFTNNKIAGQAIMVPISEAPGQHRLGRFGWKNQHGSLVSFAADAYLNEMGITSPLQPAENTSNGNSVAAFDTVPDPEDTGGLFGKDVEAFAQFMRATKVPPRDTARAATLDAQIGSTLFDRVGCNICHVRSIVTAPAGTPLNGGTFVVPAALGDKIIHPFSDFLLHDVETGDGIVQNGGDSTRNKLRTPPLWGVRTRTRLMHDGTSMTFREGIVRHQGEAEQVIRRYRLLSNKEEQQLIAFLYSL
jgi:CxxC motif-containing protein (DUF1111 family)